MVHISHHRVQKQAKQYVIDALIAQCVTDACAKMSDLRQLPSETRPKHSSEKQKVA